MKIYMKPMNNNICHKRLLKIMHQIVEREVDLEELGEVFCNLLVGYSIHPCVSIVFFQNSCCNNFTVVFFVIDPISYPICLHSPRYLKFLDIPKNLIQSLERVTFKLSVTTYPKVLS